MSGKVDYDAVQHILKHALRDGVHGGYTASFIESQIAALADAQSVAAGGEIEEVRFRAAFFVSKNGNHLEQLTSYADYLMDGAELSLMDLGQKRASARGLTKKGRGSVTLASVGAALATQHGDNT